MVSSPVGIGVQARFGVQGQKRAFWYQYISVILLILCSVLGTLSARKISPTETASPPLVLPAPLVLHPHIFQANEALKLDAEALQPIVSILLAHDLSANIEIFAGLSNQDLVLALTRAETLRQALQIQGVPQNAFNIFVNAESRPEPVQLTFRRAS